MAQKRNYKVLQVTLSPEVRRLLEQLSAAAGKSRSATLSRLVIRAASATQHPKASKP